MRKTIRHLTLVHSRDDLPSAWDGQPITWGTWRDMASTWSLHAPRDQRACASCGAIDGPCRINLGVVDNTSRLYVTRCACGHDVVYDRETDESWDLDLSDYGPDGSTVEGSLW